MDTQKIDSSLKFADGHTMPNQGLGVYKMTEERELIDSVKVAYDAGYRCLIPPKCMAMKRLLVKRSKN